MPGFISILLDGYSLRAALASAHADRVNQGPNVIATQQSPSLQHQDMVYHSLSTFGGNGLLESQSDSTHPVCSSTEYSPASQIGEVPIFNDIPGLVSFNQHNLLVTPKQSVQTPNQNPNHTFAKISQLGCQPAKLDEPISNHRTHTHHFTQTQLSTVIIESVVQNDDNIVIRSPSNTKSFYNLSKELTTS